MRKINTAVLPVLFAILLLFGGMTAYAEGWTDAYTAQLNILAAGTPTDPKEDSAPECSYLLYDIDKDGIPELITKTGTCEADYMGTVYTFVDGGAAKAGEFGMGHAGLYSDPGENGILLYWGHMGSAGCTRYSLTNGGIASEVIFEETLDIQNDPSAKYTPMEEIVPGTAALELFPADNLLPLSAYGAVVNTDVQLSLIYAEFSSFRQIEAEKDWSYTITDLDHNGLLEVLAASEHDISHSTDLKVWEVKEDGSSFAECTISVEEEESFPDIISESADTFHDASSNEWYYLFYDNIIISDQASTSVKCSVTKKGNEISYEQYAMQHVEVVNGQTTVTYTDNGGNAIAQDAYNAAGINATAGFERSSTCFDWFGFKDASLGRISDSYAVFNGEKQPVRPEPVPTTSPAPTAVPTAAPQPALLMVTKNPTNESHKEGETAWFVSNANNWSSLSWTIVGTNGVEYPISAMRDYFPNCPVGGADGTSLSIGNVSSAMNGFGFYCTFYFNGQSARTSTAYLYVAETPTPPPGGTISGTVADGTMNVVTIYLSNGQTVQVPTSICDSSNGIAIGCSCDVYYSGYAPSAGNITYVYVYSGSPQPPQPTYGSVSGTVWGLAQGIVMIDLNTGGSVQVSQSICNMVNGSMREGDQCTVYYYGEYPTVENITGVDVYDYGGGAEEEIPVEWQDWYNEDVPVEWQDWG